MGRERICILTSGGDAPGMNAAIRAATLVALDRGWSVVGAEAGYRGLIAGEFRPLAIEDVTEIIRDGGTVLGSARCPEFMTREGRDTARRRLTEARIGGVVVIGGNGSLTGARALGDPGEGGDAFRVIGVPASIDNDIGYTSMAIGVDTAMNTIVECCDKIADTAAAHDRAFIVEVMGRDCGYLAMTTSVSAGADVVLFRESGKDAEALVNEVAEAIVQAHQRRKRRRVLVIKAEGVQIGTAELKDRVDARLAAQGARFETRVVVLGHVVRGGRPSAADRLMATRLGHAAVRAIMAGETGRMVAWSPSGRLPASAVMSPVDPRCALIGLDEVLAETARLLDGQSPIAQWRAKVFDEM
ncbi:MAG: 6-phosphofructokinase, partial [Myxococcales bacterium]|nr:6-phosphofructokinase [Myxococcales bacterium]